MKKNIVDLDSISRNLRIKVLKTAKKTGGKGSHLGGTFSSIELIVALYYGGILKFDSNKPIWKNRDRFLVGKGHIHLALYHIWNDLGFFKEILLIESSHLFVESFCMHKYFGAITSISISVDFLSFSKSICFLMTFLKFSSLRSFLIFLEHCFSDKNSFLHSDDFLKHSDGDNFKILHIL